jgi:hypothetical protein
MASRSFGYGKSFSIAVRTAAITSLASAPIMVKPTMRPSLPPIRAFMKRCFSPVACALDHKARLFTGSDRGGKLAAIMYPLIQTVRLNGVDPQAWLADVLSIQNLGDFVP